jgi:hypothetical protein
MIESHGCVLLAGFMIAFGVVFGGCPMALGSTLMMLRGGDMRIFGHMIVSFNSNFRIGQQTWAAGWGT